MKTIVAMGADHAGVELKEELKSLLVDLGYQVRDMGSNGPEPVDYPEYAARVARELISGRAQRGILACGTGIGMSIVANRFPGVRAALCHDLRTALMSRRHNDANCLVLGGRLLEKGLAREITRAWLEEPFEGGRHKVRLDRIRELEMEISSSTEK
ncbi:MAG: ribose 5-phosphate isomerase B [Thermodesulfobacteriota bacterium]